MILVLILFLRLPFSKQKNIKDGYETLSFSDPTGKFADADFVNKHKVPTSSFKYSSTGDRNNNPISNAFDDKSNTYWVSDKPENASFHPSIYINFTTPILLEAFLYDAAYHTPDSNSNRIFDGFPGRLKVYTSINDEPLTLNSIFSGTLLYTWSRIQFKLSVPVKCSRLQLEFYDVSPATSLKSEEKLAGSGGITLIQNFGYDELNNRGTENNYADNNYVNFHKIPTSKFSYTSTGDRSGNPLSNVFDEKGNTYWVSDRPETNEFHPSISINFTEPVSLEAFLYDAAYRTDNQNNERTFDGFPSTLKVYTSLDNAPLSLHTVFTGTPSYPDLRIQFVFGRPVKCTKIKLEFCDVSVAQSLQSTEKLAGVGNLIFLQSTEEEGLSINQATGNYNDTYYLSTHTIPTSNFTYSSTGDKKGYPLSGAFDSVVKSHWVSGRENTDDFHASIFVNFTETVDLEAVLIYAAFHSGSNSRTFDGYPIKFKIHTAVGQGPFKLSALFVGTPIYPWETIQFVLPEAVRCDRIQLEFVEVTPETVFSKGARCACVSGIYFIRHFDYQYTSFEVAKGYYIDKSYISSHLVPLSNFTYMSTGDLKGHPISGAFDSKYADSWVSSFENTATTHASIFVNFTEALLLEAFVYEAGYVTDKSTNQRVLVGFPQKLIIHAALNDEPLTQKAFFIGTCEPPTTKYQFVFPSAIPCNRIQIEFVEVTPEKAFSNSKPCALAHQIDFFSSPLVEISGSTVEGDISTIYVNNSYVKDTITGSDFNDVNLPKNEEYIFVVQKKFSFVNNSFTMNQNRISVIKGSNSPQIVIDNCTFLSCSTKNIEGNGGTINIENCGMKLENSKFDNSSTSGGGGGGLFVRLDQPIENELSVNGCTFSNCSAVFGGAVYIYSSISTNVVKVNYCSFESNKALSKSSDNYMFSGGSALLLCARNAQVLGCRFTKNHGKGGAFKIIDDFVDVDSSAFSGKSSKSMKSNSLVIKDCFFEIASDSSSSLSYEHGKSKSVSVSVDDCTFTGELAEDAHHIEDSSATKDSKMIRIKSCKFSSGKEKAVNGNFNGLFNVEFNFGESENEISSAKTMKKTKRQYNLAVQLTSAVFVVFIAIAVIVAIFIKLRNNNSINNDGQIDI